ncbi:MAG TPA: dihydrodipicolinate reductase C-terminal domain-containing protein [Chitinophaga sp.]|uniref:dihydrodipicolinate reductase C-terminal domain-containing protein n=1 Tax=Chitinophaga sp. TaxID=1869181 RepID=UPI002BF64B40|nr:dihydrodipicolinate reductase C-terminal domain-containing protein [Chitinophaga sp.]HVI46375.1 dihydrodipicolinate reductase C-terminal domain-containing protein [Chitinophaga sp.]
MRGWCHRLGWISAPSGTVRQLVKRLSDVQIPTEFVKEDEMVGPREARGAKVNGVRVHALRLPGYVIAVEAIFGAHDERLTIRHDAGASAEPYVNGGLLAIKKVSTFKGLKRGLDSVMD